jgi:hypothetical protein
MADASATGGGKAIANAIATVGFPSNFGGPVPLPTRTANATSTAETANGAMAQALSTINPNSDEFAGTGEAPQHNEYTKVWLYETNKLARSTLVAWNGYARKLNSTL